MARTFSKVFNDPDYDVIITEVVNSTTYASTINFATLILADEYLNGIKTELTNLVNNYNNKIIVLNDEISNIDIALG